jgi:bacterioferritin-associated ferredoxin
MSPEFSPGILPLCYNIRKGTVLKAIHVGAKTFEQVSKRTGVGTGPCGRQRCGTLVRGMLREARHQLQ